MGNSHLVSSHESDVSETHNKQLFYSQVVREQEVYQEIFGFINRIDLYFKL